MKPYISFIFFLWCFAGVRAAEYDLGTNGVLSVTVPENWEIKGKPITRLDGSIVGCTFVFRPQGDLQHQCTVTFACGTNGAPTAEFVRERVKFGCQRFLTNSVEKQINLRDLKLPKGFGAYCLLTDASLAGKEPEAGQFKILGIGVVAPADNVVGAVSIAVDEAQGAEFEWMIHCLESIRVKPK